MFARLLFLFSLLVLLAGPAHAQDFLTKRNGDEVAVKVVEITPAEVKYRRADNPDGPLISIWRTDVFMIRYANGTKEVLNAAPAAAAGVGVPVSAAAARAAFPAEVPTLSNASPDDAILDEPIRLDGPRIGFTVLSASVLDKARESVPDLNPFLTQFGWQFESRLFRMPNGVSGLAEFVPLVGGLEQGKFLPSISGLLGIRGAKGLEFGVGPNLTPLGTNLVLAMGTSFHSNGINFPVNVAVVPGNGGARISLMLGFNARHR
ncbi:hypothetical protein [Hymenobacter negativus]|uniref:Uncharacterized protein n=1 Tax=Hymenobacter negativus TaxID=2795026 RepID=A0ABS0QAN9_9BACT|nr:hypothetical protein [Hymenobacter negativus]MBH8559730.1 hypothetical protein [Hymenobacter negativus]